MEDKLISSQWLINDLLNKSFYPAIVKSSIESAPAVDAVEVVRCENCKHSVPMREFEHRNEEPYKYFRNDIFLCFHEFVGNYPICFEGDFFCKYGERK